MGQDIQPLEALIFDVDGTLAETELHGHLRAFNETFADFKLDWHWSSARYAELLKISGGKERMAHDVASGGSTAPSQAASPAKLNDLIQQLHEAKTQRYQDLLSQGEISLRPGVERIIKEARASGIRLAIATTTSPGNVESLLSATLGHEAVSWFEVIAAGDVVANKKPAPDIYHLALQQLQLPATACLAFEDSNNGLLAAQGADIATVITPAHFTGEDDFASAELCLSDLGEPSQPCQQLASNAEAFNHAGYFSLASAQQLLAHLHG